MKNILTIDYDNERDNIIVLYKEAGFIQPTTNEEASKLLLNDLQSVFQTLTYLIDVIEASGNAKRDDLINTCIEGLNTQKSKS